MRSLLGTAVLALVPTVVGAGPPQALEPALQLSWRFGATAASPAPQLRLGVYPGDLAWQRLCADLGVRELAQLPQRPELVGIAFGREPRWHLGGLALDGTATSEPNWPLRIGVGVAVVVGVGALAISAVGDAWGDAAEAAFTPPAGEDADDDGDDGQGGILCVDDQCVLPCDTTGPVNSCNDG
jgi:hypothetical protein